jgi:hypothetical protein
MSILMRIQNAGYTVAKKQRKNRNCAVINMNLNVYIVVLQSEYALASVELSPLPEFAL